MKVIGLSGDDGVILTMTRRELNIITNGAEYTHVPSGDKLVGCNFSIHEAWDVVQILNKSEGERDAIAQKLKELSERLRKIKFTPWSVPAKVKATNE